MISRSFQASDIPEIRKLYEKQGYPYDFPDLTGPLMESVRVIEDDAGRVVAAVALERIVQAYLWCDGLQPAQLQRIVEHFDKDLKPEMRKRGYEWVTAFLPPSIDAAFGRWLSRRFGWKKSWQAWSKCTI